MGLGLAFSQWWNNNRTLENSKDEAISIASSMKNERARKVAEASIDESKQSSGDKLSQAYNARKKFKNTKMANYRKAISQGNIEEMPELLQIGLTIHNYSLETNNEFKDMFDAYAQLSVDSGEADFDLLRGVVSKYYYDQLKGQGYSSEDIKKLKDDGTLKDFEGLISNEEFQTLNADEGRYGKELSRFGNQLLYGASTFLETPDDPSTASWHKKVKDFQSDKREAMDEVDEGEQLWKGWNATLDADEESGYNIPWNIKGTMGSITPYAASGVFSGVALSSRMGQLLAGSTIDHIMDWLRYKEHGDIFQAFSDSVFNTMPLSGATQLTNAFRHDVDKLKGTVTTPNKLRGLENRLQALKKLNQGEARIPARALQNPSSAASQLKGTKNPERRIKGKRAIRTAHDDFSKIYDEALAEIGASSTYFENKLPALEKAYPLGTEFKNYIKGKQEEFKEIAKPFKKAYQEVGDKYTLDTDMLLDKQILGGTENAVARSHLKKAINNLTGKQPKAATGSKSDFFDPEMGKDVAFDTQNITANQADSIVKDVQQDLINAATNANSGSLTSPDAQAALKRWIASMKTKLIEDLPDEFTVPYKEAKKHFAAAFKLSQEGLGKNLDSPIKGIAKAMKESTGREMQELFTGKDSTHNISQLGQVLDNNDELYGGIMRNYIESKVEASVHSMPGVSTRGAFNLGSFKEGLKDVDYTALKRILPNKEGAVDSLSALEGFYDMMKPGGKSLTDVAALESLPKIDSYLNPFRPRTYAQKLIRGSQDLTDISTMNSRYFGPWFSDRPLKKPDPFIKTWRRTTAPASRPDLFEGFKPQEKRLTKEIEKGKEALDRGELVKAPNELMELIGEGASKLYGPHFADFTWNKTLLETLRDSMKLPGSDSLVDVTAPLVKELRDSSLDELDTTAPLLKLLKDRKNGNK